GSGFPVPVLGEAVLRVTASAERGDLRLVLGEVRRRRDGVRSAALAVGCRATMSTMTQTETTPHGLTLTGLDGKVAVVTGAGRMRSIGRAIAVELARAGCDVVITGTGRPPERYPDDEKAAGWRDVDSVADEVRDLGRRALPVVSDVADDGAVEQLAARVTDELGRVDFVVNNAGAARGPDRVPVVDLAPDIWRHVIDVNLNGTFYMSRAFGRVLVEQGEGGAIVNISSIGGKWMAARTAAYAASKAGIHALTCAMASELGPDQV